MAIKECFIDVHCHLDMIELDIMNVIENAMMKDVKIIVTQGVNPNSNRIVLSLAEKNNIVRAALGIYPLEALALSVEEIDDEIEFIRKNKDKLSAIGEVGMDFKESNDKERQKKIFNKFVKLSIELEKPIIVHSRKAELECIEILEKNNAKKVVMHCFSGKFSLVKRIIDNGWFFSIPGSVKNSEHFQKIIKETPIEQLLCETDSPYLHPDKEWPNEPANVVVSYEKIGEIKGLKLDEVKKKVFDNYFKLFN